MKFRHMIINANKLVVFDNFFCIIRERLFNIKTKQETDINEIAIGKVGIKLIQLMYRCLLAVHDISDVARQHSL